MDIVTILFFFPALAILILITRLFGAFMFRIDDVLKALKETNSQLQSISSNVAELKKQGKGKDSDI